MGHLLITSRPSWAFSTAAGSTLKPREHLSTQRQSQEGVCPSPWCTHITHVPVPRSLAHTYACMHHVSARSHMYTHMHASHAPTHTHRTCTHTPLKPSCAACSRLARRPPTTHHPPPTPGVVFSANRALSSSWHCAPLHKRHFPASLAARRDHVTCLEPMREGSCCWVFWASS